MESSNPQSFFHNIRSRELNGFRGPLSLSVYTYFHVIIISHFAYAYFSVRKRPYISDAASDITEIGAVAVEHCGDETPPLAISFCKVQK
jgi:denticleless